MEVPNKKVQGKQLPVVSAAFPFIGAWLWAEESEWLLGTAYPPTAHVQCPLQSRDGCASIVALAREVLTPVKAAYLYRTLGA